MKRATALRMAHTVAARLRAACGLIGTPGTCSEAVRVRRAWLFGSTAKGSLSPNDVDILIEMNPVGRQFTTERIAQVFGVRGGARVDKSYYRRYGIELPMDAVHEVRRHLRGHMKMLRLHNYAIDKELALPRILIYPRNDLTEGKPC